MEVLSSLMEDWSILVSMSSKDWNCSQGAVIVNFVIMWHSFWASYSWKRSFGKEISSSMVKSEFV